MRSLVDPKYIVVMSPAKGDDNGNLTHDPNDDLNHKKHTFLRSTFSVQNNKITKDLLFEYST